MQKRGSRVEMCRKCELLWNISVHSKIPKIGYKCPFCQNGQEGQKRRPKIRHIDFLV